MTTRVFEAGVIQFDIRMGDVEQNVFTANKRITFLAHKGVRLVLLPEMWTSGFANEYIEEISKTTPDVLENLAWLSKELGVTIIGSMPEKMADGIYNSAYVVDIDGSISGVYRKVHLFSLTGEDRYFRAGEKAVIAKTSVGRVGLMICYDLRFPELCRSLALRGAEIVAIMAQWPAARIAHWKALLKARAIENQLIVLGANRCGEDAHLTYGGHSRIISPWGEVMARAGKGPATLSAAIDFSSIKQTRRQIPCLDERVPMAYE